MTGHDAPLDYHRRMLDDPHRMDAYERALRRLVRPGDVVLDLGCGTGILAMLAVRCGAARVHAVESMPVIGVARALARANGMAGRIVFHEADATALAPVEPVDLVVSDFLGVFLADDLMLPAVRAAARWLKPGGRIVPEHVRLLLAPVGDFALQNLDFATASLYGVDLGALGAAVLAQTCRVELGPHLLLAPAAEYLAVRPPDEVAFDRRLEFTVARAGRLRGVAGWFEATLAPGIVLANAPGIETHWGQLLFPHAPVAVEAGDRLSCRVRLRSADNDWAWSGQVTRAGAAVFDYGETAAPAAPRARPEGDPHALGLAANDRGAAAYQADRVDEAAEAWEEAIRLLDPRAEPTARVHENLGLAYHFLGRHQEAVRAFLRALDGVPTAREQALRFLVQACLGAGRRADAARYLALYEGAFGKHPTVSR